MGGFSLDWTALTCNVGGRLILGMSSLSSPGIAAASWAVGPTICSATTASFWLEKTIFFQVGVCVPYRLGAPTFHICGEGTEWLLFLLPCSKGETRSEELLILCVQV